ncbi:MAG: efflux RND transporter permease subunit, partial [Isosphaeraceae bacterium]
SNSRLSTTESRVKQVENFLKQHISENDREMIVSEIGLNPDWSAAYTSNAGQQDALIRIQLKPGRVASSQAIASRLRQKFNDSPEFADLRAEWDTGGMVSTALNYGASSPIDIEISGGNATQMAEISRKIRNLVAGIAGTVDVRVAQREDAPYIVLDVDREKASRLGMSTEDVMQQVVVALNSSVSIHRNFWIDSQSGNQYFIGVQYPEDAQRRLEDILSIPITGSGQPQPVNLGSLVTPRRKSGAVEISHSGLKRVSNVLVNIEGRDTAGTASEIQNKLKSITLPGGMRVELKGEFRRMNESFQRLGMGLVLAALLVYLLQVTLFRSWTGPLVIMFTVPLGIIGVVVMLFLTKTTLNVQSLMGIIFLVGIAVNNGVLLVEFANRLQMEGSSPAEAIRKAAETRFRPILMTFLATVLALSPMAIGGGHGNEANIPLARAVVGGLISSTTLTLFFVPVIYTMIIRQVKPLSDIEEDYDGIESIKIHTV